MPCRVRVMYKDADTTGALWLTLCLISYASRPLPYVSCLMSYHFRLTLFVVCHICTPNRVPYLHPESCAISAPRIVCHICTPNRVPYLHP